MRYIGTTPNPYGDTLLTSDANDQINVKVAGAEDFRIAANTLSVLSGTTLNIDSGATIANSGTATGFGGVDTSGTPVDNQLAIFTDADTVEGDADLTYDGTTLAIAGDVTMAAGKQLFLNCSANAEQVTGITVQSGVEEDAYLALKEDDCVHGGTGAYLTETDTFLEITGNSQGTATIIGYRDSSAAALRMTGWVNENADTLKATNRNGIKMDTVGQIDGDARGDVVANGNCFAWQAWTGGAVPTIMILDEDGDLHVDGVATGTYDGIDDALVLREFDHLQKQAGGKGMIETEWDSFVDAHAGKLSELGIVPKPDYKDKDWFAEDGSKARPLWCVTKHVKLLTGQAWQSYVRQMVMVGLIEKLLPGFAEDLNNELQNIGMPLLPMTIEEGS